MNDDIVIVGSAWIDVPESTDLQIEELAFECSSEALRDAGVLPHQVGLSVACSMDLYDARTISSGLITPAAAGYLKEEFRVEGDALSAFLFAGAALTARQADVAIVIGVHIPEIATSKEDALRRVRHQISSLTFDSHLDRPVGMNADVTLGLHASAVLNDDPGARAEWASRTAADINRGVSGRGTRRTHTTPEDVLSAPVLVAPLTKPMLPATSAGVGAIVLASGITALRCPRPRARVTGWGTATSPTTSNPGWLASPAEATGRAASQAFRRAGVEHPAEEIGWLEMSDLSPSLSSDLLDAMSLGSLDASRVNPSGGVRSNFPGIANGLLRAIEATEALGDEGADARAVVHTQDDLCGFIASTATVLVLERV